MSHLTPTASASWTQASLDTEVGPQCRQSSQAVIKLPRYVAAGGRAEVGGRPVPMSSGKAEMHAESTVSVTEADGSGKGPGQVTGEGKKQNPNAFEQESKTAKGERARMVCLSKEKVFVVGVFLAAAAGGAEARLGGSGARALQSPPKKVANVGVTFHGMDILRFDPDDPAGASLRQMIFRGEYNVGQVTADGQFQVPDGTEMVSNLDCESQASASEVTGEKSYKDSVTNQISFKVGGGYGPVKGTVENSNTFKQVSEGTNKERKAYAFTKMTCKMYKVQLQTRNMPQLTTNFVKSVNAIRGQSWDSSDLTLFVADYGTHYVTSSSLGSKYVESFVSSREETSMLRSSTTSIKVGAEVSALGNSAGSEYLNEREKSQKESFDKYASQYSSRVLGANVPLGQTPQTLARSWVDETLKSNALQMIADFEFAGLDGLFVASNLDFINENLKREAFAPMTKEDLSAVEMNVRQAIMNSCTTFGLKCDGSTADLPAPAAAKVNPVPIDQLFSAGQGNGGAPFQLSGDVGKLFGKSDGQTVDMHVSRVKFWTTVDKNIVKQGTPFIQGVRVFYKDSQGFESSTGVAGKDTGTLCEIEIPEGDQVGAVDFRSGKWVDYVEIRNRKGFTLGKCGSQTGGTLTTVRIGSDQQLNGFFGRGGDWLDRLGAQIADVTAYAT